MENNTPYKDTIIPSFLDERGIMWPKHYGRLLFYLFFKKNSLYSYSKKNRKNKFWIRTLQWMDGYDFLLSSIVSFLCTSLFVYLSAYSSLEDALLEGKAGVALGVIGYFLSLGGIVLFRLPSGTLAGTTCGMYLAHIVFTSISPETTNYFLFIGLLFIVSYMSSMIFSAYYAPIQPNIVLLFSAILFLFILYLLDRYISFTGVLCYFITFILVKGRFYYFFYYPIYQKGNPLWWDQNIDTPVPFLAKILRYQAHDENVSKIINFIRFLLSGDESNINGSLKSLIFITLDHLKKLNTISDIKKMPEKISFFPTDISTLYIDGFGHDVQDLKERYSRLLGISSYFFEINVLGLKYIKSLQTFSEDLRKADAEQNFANKIGLYDRTRKALREYGNTVHLKGGPYAKDIRAVAQVWEGAITKAIDEIRASGQLPLPNPYLTGKPTQIEHPTFVGRRDILEKIETETLRMGGSGTLLFIGARRTGKTSTLLNLPRFVASGLHSVYADMQSALFNTDTAAFSEQMAQCISEALRIPKPAAVRDLAQLTRLLQTADAQLQRDNGYLLICMDEYERIGKCVAQGRLTELPDALRSWIQHLQRVVFLLAGSHEPSELREIDWTDYLINVRNVPISYLDQESALQLVTRPLPEFDLSWQSEDLPETLVRRLGRQPYLLQSVMWNLVEDLNRQSVKTAAPADVDTAIQKTLDQDARNYFDHIWHTELDADSRALLLALMQGVQPAPGPALNRLFRRDMLYRDEPTGRIGFCVPVWQEWIKLITVNV